MAKFTKQAIYDSFMKFLNERPLGQITVKDIVDDCGINRKTFYYYFQDIYALTDELFRSHIETVRTKYPAESHSWEEVLQLITDYMYENRKVALHIYRTLGYEKIDGIFFEVGMEYIPNLIGTYVKELEVRQEDIDLISSYAAISVAGMLTQWLSDGMKTIPTDTVRRFALIMKGTARTALENAAELNRSERKA